DAYGASNLKDPLNPDWDDDPAMQEYLETVQASRPDGFDPENAVVGYGYTQAAIFIEALEQAEAPTRLAVMEAMYDLEVSDVGLLLPGVTIRTSPDDKFMGETVQLAQYEWTGPDARNHFVPQGDLIDYEGRTAEVTPEELITSGPGRPRAATRDPVTGGAARRPRSACRPGEGVLASVRELPPAPPAPPAPHARPASPRGRDPALGRRP